MTQVKYEQTRCTGNSQKKSNKTKTKAIKMFDFNTSKEVYFDSRLSKIRMKYII